MKFKQKFALLKRNTETRVIGDQTFTFYPISIPMLFDLKSSMQPLMSALKFLFNKGNNDGTQTVEETRDPLTQNVLARVTHLGAVPVEASRFRAEQADKAVADALEAVLGEKNRMLLGRVLADSLRDEDIRTDEEINAFIRDPAFDLPLLVEFLSGFFAVNAKVFGPLAERVKVMVREKMSNLAQNQTPNQGSDTAPESPVFPMSAHDPLS